MSDLAQSLLLVIQRGPILFGDLWESIPYEQDFDEMHAALAELIEAGQVEKISDTFAFRVATTA